MEPIKCIAVDDERPALDKLVRFIELIPFLDLIGQFNDASEAMAFLQMRSVDLVFLDIQMEKITGIQFIESLPNRPVIILVTAYDNYAMKGFDLDVCDYILKPYDFERFNKSALKALKLLRTVDGDQNIHNESDSGRSRDFIFIKTAYKLEKVNLDEIYYIQGMRDYLLIYLENRRIVTLQSFREIENFLPPDMFARVHKSYMVALDKIQSIERKRIRILEEIIPISASRYDDFIGLLRSQNRLGG